MAAKPTMSYQIILQLEDVAGALSRVMSCLRKLGLGGVAQSFEVRSEGGRNLILEVAGLLLEEERLRAPLETVNGVAALSSYGEKAGSALLSESRMEGVTETEMDEIRYKNRDSEAGDADIRDRMLIFSLLSRYPQYLRPAG